MIRTTALKAHTRQAWKQLSECTPGVKWMLYESQQVATWVRRHCCVNTNFPPYSFISRTGTKECQRRENPNSHRGFQFHRKMHYMILETQSFKVKRLYLYGAFLVFPPLKALYTTCQSLPHSHTDGSCHARCHICTCERNEWVTHVYTLMTQNSRSSVSCPRTQSQGLNHWRSD